MNLLVLTIELTIPRREVLLEVESTILHNALRRDDEFISFIANDL